MGRGGSRERAGRKQVFTFEKKLALANEVTLRQQKKPESINHKSTDPTRRRRASQTTNKSKVPHARIL